MIPKNNAKKILPEPGFAKMAEIKENEIRTVKPDDFYILCPNCHRMIRKR